LPRSGFEVYAEYGRDDHNGDRRDLLQEPDHIAIYGLGLQKAWITHGGSIVSLGGELLNFEVSTLARHRAQGAVYGHSFVEQGHTHRGQLLGAGFGVGSGAGSSIRVERYTKNGSESFGWSRLVRQERPNPDAINSRCGEACLTVQHVLRADGQRIRGRMAVRIGLAAVYEMNRDFRSDVMNFNPSVEVRWHP
jgi:hypothetical protein